MYDHLSHYDIILGTGSPRRHELFDKLRIDYTIRTTDIEEILPPNHPIMDAASYLSELKANDLRKTLKPNELLITADTVVIHEDQILGKPKSKEEALATILSMSGKTHLVNSGVTITTTDRQETFDDTTSVTFAEVSQEEARWYIDRDPVMDKAGSYGIQDWIGLTKAIHIEGSYYNIMGLPIHKLYERLMKWK